jgi:hypothetical protein
MSIIFYVLIKKNVRHATRQGEQETLCGASIRKGERGRNLVWFGQVSCPNCKKAFALAPKGELQYG